MACDTIADIVVAESGRYNDELYNRMFDVSPWVRLVQRAAWQDGMGDVINVLTYERSAPTDAEPTWSALLLEGGFVAEGGLCLPTPEVIAIASTTRNYNLARRVLHGPSFCVENIRFSFQLRKQLDSVLDILAEYVMIEWEIRDRHEYLRLAKRKVVVRNPPVETLDVTTAGGITGTYWNNLCPTSILTQGILDRWRMKLLRDGASRSALGMQDGNPILTAILSAETSNDIIFRNADVRDDLRWGKPSELLAPFGVNRSYKGFFHLIDSYPIRGSCGAGVFAEIAAFYTIAASKGNKAEVRPAWEAASTEVSHIFDTTVFTQLIPRPITTPASGFTFDPVNYTGDWRVKNIIDKDCNPDGTILFHRGILAAASEPVHPERGVGFLHMRCDPSANLTACS